MKSFWFVSSILLFVNDCEVKSLDRQFTCDTIGDADLAKNLNSALALIIRDVKLASPFALLRNTFQMNGIKDCKSKLKALKNLAPVPVNPSLNYILKYCQKNILTMPSPQKEYYWEQIKARGYKNVQVFLLPFKKLSEIKRSKQFIKGKTLRAAARDQRPSITFKLANDTKTVIDVRGDNFELIEILRNSLGFNYTIVPSFESSAFLNGSWRGTIGMLAKKEVDINIQPFSHDASRNRDIDFSVYSTNVAFTLIIPYPTEKRSLLASTWPFSPSVWLCLSATMLVLTFTLTIAAVTKTQQMSFSQAASQSFMFTYGLITCQGLECPGRTHKSRLLAGIWGMAGLVFVYTYNSQLTSYLTVPQLNPLVNSIDELAKTDELNIILMAGNTIMNEFLEATSGPYKVIGDRIRKNVKGHVAQTYEEAIEKVVSGTHAFAVNLHTGVHYGNIFFQKTRTCSLMVVKHPMNNVYSTLTLQKGSPYTPAISEKILRITNGGIMVYIMKNSNNGLPRFQEQCKVPIKDFPINVKLTLSQLLSAFAVLGIGLLASSVALTCEIIIVQTRK